MSDIQRLGAEDEAVLSLVVARSMSFEEIGALLRLHPDVVRERAHAAVTHLVAPPEGTDPQDRERVLDFVLGQLAAAELHDELRGAALRQWAISLTGALAPLAKLAVPEPAVRPQAGVDARSVARAPAPRLRARPRRRLRAPLLATVVIASAATIAIVALTASKSTTPGAGGPPHVPVPTVQLVRRLTLQPTPLARGAVAAGAVIRRGTSLQLLLQAKGLAPNSGDSYAVWLVNTRVDSRLLGFVTPQVGSAGTFSSGVTLPADAIRFRLVLVTRERSARPYAPGTAVLRGPLALS